MKILYFDLGMGAAGDMLTAALLELVPHRREEFLAVMNSLGLPGVKVCAESSIKCGITGTHLDVSVHGVHEQSIDVGGQVDESGDEHPAGHHHHGEASEQASESHSRHHHGDHDHAHSSTGIGEIVQTILGFDIAEKAAADAIGVYSHLAAAESAVHGMPVEQMHFHEVGQSDAIADIVGAAVLMNWIAPDRVLGSAVHIGGGKVRCAHGIVSVPAPATERLLRGIPVYGGDVHAELCTPTGAALLAYFIDEFVQAMPLMRVSQAGYGMGAKDFEIANCVRALIGEPVVAESADDVIDLTCNLDDMTGEAIGYAQKQLFAAGALEVFTVPVTMKRGRPGVMLTCLVPVAFKEEVVKAMFKHTTTIGVREYACARHVLDRTEETVQTSYGSVRVKAASGYGVSRRKIEYQDLAAIADREDLSLEVIRRRIDEQQNPPGR